MILPRSRDIGHWPDLGSSWPWCWRRRQELISTQTMLPSLRHPPVNNVHRKDNDNTDYRYGTYPASMWWISFGSEVPNNSSSDIVHQRLVAWTPFPPETRIVPLHHRQQSGFPMLRPRVHRSWGQQKDSWLNLVQCCNCMSWISYNACVSQLDM